MNEAPTGVSRLELVVLATLSQRKPPSERSIAEAVQPLALPAESLGEARAAITQTLNELRARGLVDPTRRALTDDGRRALRGALQLERTPTWREVRDLHLPALALGLQPGSAEAKRALQDGEAIQASVLGAELGVREVRTLRELCNELVVASLGMAPTRVTLNRILAHVLAQRAGVEAKGEPSELGARLAAAALRARKSDKRSLARALARRWTTSNGASAPAPGSNDFSAAVVAAVPRVGPTGRYGPEKVFISALWRALPDSAKSGGMTLEVFKRWLLDANAAGSVVLARADLVGAMDPTLVSESEVADRGATFHFVLDGHAV
jgi:hypothetical protein